MILKYGNYTLKDILILRRKNKDILRCSIRGLHFIAQQNNKPANKKQRFVYVYTSNLKKFDQILMSCDGKREIPQITELKIII
jgi:hypothetical protein